MSDCTVASNTATAGGGINNTSGGSATLNNTIVAGDIGGDITNSGTLTGTFNWVGDGIGSGLTFIARRRPEARPAGLERRADADHGPAWRQPGHQ